LALTIAVCVGMGCRSDETPEREGRPEGRPTTTVAVPVEVATIETADMTRAVQGNTTVRSAHRAMMVSEISGRVVELNVVEGEIIEAGTLVARVVNEDLAITLREARASVDRYDAEVATLAPLFEQGYISRQVFDEVRFQQATAQTNLQRVRAQVSSQVVRSQIGGAVVARPVNLGEIVMPNQTLAEVVATDALEAVLSVPERELRVLREGQIAELVADALGPPAFRGVVERINPVVDPQTGTVSVRVVVLDATERPDGSTLRPGMFVNVRIVTDTRSRVPVVAKRALIYEGDDAFVYVIQGAYEGTEDAPAPEGETWYTVDRVRLVLGYEESARAEVVSGLSEGDRVVIAGQSGLSSESIVSIGGTTRRGPRGGRAEDDGSSSSVLETVEGPDEVDGRGDRPASEEGREGAPDGVPEAGDGVESTGPQDTRGAGEPSEGVAPADEGSRG